MRPPPWAWIIFAQVFMAGLNMPGALDGRPESMFAASICLLLAGVGVISHLAIRRLERRVRQDSETVNLALRQIEELRLLDRVAEPWPDPIYGGGSTPVSSGTFVPTITTST